MKKIVLYFILALIFTLYLAGTVVSMPELVNPQFIKVFNNRIYVIEGIQVLIYDLNQKKLIRKIGTRGEGPGEFNVIPNLNRGMVQIDVNEKFLAVSSRGKISLFTPDGEFIRDLKSSVQAPLAFYRFYGDGYIASILSGNQQGTSVSVALFDKNLQQTKQVFKRLIFSMREGKFDPIIASRFPLFFVHNNQIMIEAFAGKDEGNILVYDIKGNIVRKIFADAEKKLVEESDRKRVDNYYRTNPRTRNGYEFLKKLFEFNKYFPQIRNYQFTGQKLYFQTYNHTGEKTNFVVKDLSGKVLIKKLISVPDYDDMYSVPFTFNEGKIYRLLESADTEKWSLEIIKI